MKKVHFVGIGGIGMSALARYFLAQGYQVSGSDSGESALTEDLINEGAIFKLGHKADYLADDCDLLVYTEAVPDTNHERQKAYSLGIKQKSYFQELGDISKKYNTIAVAGTHGKSTTTGMLGLALENAGQDPTVFVGTKIFEWGHKNFRIGQSNILVAEACEYRNSFLNFDPSIVVITSLEPEHLDFFKTAENYYATFEKFIKKADTVIADLSKDNAIKELCNKFIGVIIDSSKFIDDVPKLRLPGKHNIENASKVLAVFNALGIPPDKAKMSLKNFGGTWRRFEEKGEKDGVIVFDDYAHHPTEIKTTLKALREKFPKKRVFCVFQPHQYSRTKHFLKEFGKSFKYANQTLIPNIYSVRDTEKDVQSITPEDLVQEINKHQSPARFTDGFENTVRILQNKTRAGDVVITVGAGPINEVGEEFLEN